jgi:hypothetical protein
MVMCAVVRERQGGHHRERPRKSGEEIERQDADIFA